MKFDLDNDDVGQHLFCRLLSLTRNMARINVGYEPSQIRVTTQPQPDHLEIRRQVSKYYKILP
jgi:hypothetical protein